MACYFFDTDDGDRLVKDEEGLELDGMEAVRLQSNTEEASAASAKEAHEPQDEDDWDRDADQPQKTTLEHSSLLFFGYPDETELPMLRFPCASPCWVPHARSRRRGAPPPPR
jgi:hypothetical protein